MQANTYNLDRQTDRQTDKHNCALFACQAEYYKYKPSERIGAFAATPFGWLFALLGAVSRKAREPCPVPYRQLE